MQIRTAPRFRAVLVGALSGALLHAIPCARPATAGAITWDNPLGGTFAEGSNWAGGIAPTADDDALFDLDDIYTVLFDSDASTRSLAVSRGDVTFDLQGFTYDWAPTKTDGAFRIGNDSAEDASLTLMDGVFDLPERLNLPAMTILSTGGSAELIVDNATLNFTESIISVGSTTPDSYGKLTVRNGGVVTDIGPPTSFGLMGVNDEAEVTGAGSAIIARDLSVRGALQINDGASVSTEFLSVDGVITVDNATLNRPLSMSGDGRIEVRNGGVVNPAVPDTTIAEIDIRGAGSELFLAFAGVNSSGASHFTIADGGTIGDGFLSNTDLTILPGGVLRSVPFLAGGVLRIESSAAVTLVELQRDDTDLIQIALDDSSTLVSPAMLEIGFGELNGALSLELLPGFTPSFGDRFNLFSAPGMLLGDFDTFDLPTLPGGLAFEIERTPTTLSALVIPTPASALPPLAGLAILTRRRRPA